MRFYDRYRFKILYLVAPVLMLLNQAVENYAILLFLSANISNSGCSNIKQCAYGCWAVLSLIDGCWVGGFRILNWKSNTCPQMYTHSQDDDDDDLSVGRVQLQKKTKVLVAKISVVKVTANSAVSQSLLRHSKR